jgi:hypothetical protein
MIPLARPSALRSLLRRAMLSMDFLVNSGKIVVKMNRDAMHVPQDRHSPQTLP